MTSEDKRIEDLLRPRYKVIADYPFSDFNIGDILIEHGGCWAHLDQNGDSDGNISVPEQYPHLFRKLHWAEDREAHELPSFIKIKLNEGTIVYNISAGNYLDKDFMQWKFGGRTIREFEPATESEFNKQGQQFINQHNRI